MIQALLAFPVCPMASWGQNFDWTGQSRPSMEEPATACVRRALLLEGDEQGAAPHREEWSREKRREMEIVGNVSDADAFTGIHYIKNMNKQQSHRKPNDHHVSW